MLIHKKSASICLSENTDSILKSAFNKYEGYTRAAGLKTRRPSAASAYSWRRYLFSRRALLPVITKLTVERIPQHLMPALLAGYPGAAYQRRAVPDMLTVTTVKYRHPMFLCVLLVINNLSFHLFSFTFWSGCLANILHIVLLSEQSVALKHWQVICAY